jgi:hypothetical protein
VDYNEIACCALLSRDADDGPGDPEALSSLIEPDEMTKKLLREFDARSIRKRAERIMKITNLRRG